MRASAWAVRGIAACYRDNDKDRDREGVVAAGQPRRCSFGREAAVRPTLRCMERAPDGSARRAAAGAWREQARCSLWPW